MIEKLLWATRAGDPDWKEELLTNRIEQHGDARAWAEANGFDRFRVSVLDLSIPPNFKEVLA